MSIKRISFITLALLMLFTTCVSAISPLASDFINGSDVVVNALSGEQVGLCMNVGSDETERNLVWYSPYDSGSVEYALRNGDTFPDEFTTVKTSVSRAMGETNTNIHRATIYNLKPDSEYVYRIKNGTKISQNYYFNTDPTVAFDFAFAGDPQIGASYNNTRDGNGWTKTVDFVKTKFPEISLFVTAGDQVNVGNNESQYQTFLSPSNLHTYALAPAVGNHEDAYASETEYLDLTYGIFKEHYNLPNTHIDGKNYGVTSAGYDYWYTYNNALFIHINTNNYSYSEHEEFIKHAIEQNPNVTWKFIVQHFALFGSHYFVGEAINNLRNVYGPMYQKYGIDFVLNGHEHDLVRSHMINYSDTGYTYTNVGSSITDPTGIFYLTASSSSSSKFYELIDDSLTPHIAYKEKNKQTVTYCQVTANTFKMTTYDVLNDVVLDTFEVKKTKGISTGYDENVALGKSYTKDALYVVDPTVSTVPKYDDEGNVTMTDGKLAPYDALYKHEAFMIFYTKDDWYKNQGYAQVTVDLGKSYDLQRFVAQVGTTKATAGVNVPQLMSVYVSDDKSTWTKAGECTVTNDTLDSCIPMALNLDKSVKGRYVQYRFVGTGTFITLAEVEAYTAHKHTEGEMIQISNATALNDGRKESRCTTCGSVVNYEIIPAFNSDPNNRNRALNKSYTLDGLCIPEGYTDPKYPDENGITMTDGILAPEGALYKDQTYAGFDSNSEFYKQNGYVYITVDLQQTYKLDKFVADVATSLATAGVKAPETLSVYVSNDNATWTNVGTVNVTDSTTEYHIPVILELKKAVSARYVQYRFVPLNKVGFVMVSEIEAHEALPSDSVDVEKNNVAYQKVYDTTGIFTTDGVASYPDEGGVTLTDGKNAPGTAKYNDAAFAGFNNQSSDYASLGYASITVDLAKQYRLDEFAVCVGTAALSSGIFAPGSIEIYVSNDKSNWSAVGTVIPEDVYDSSVTKTTLSLASAVTGRYVQYRIKSNTSWIMVAEVEAYEALPEVVEHEHSYSKDWKSDASGHWHECACNDKTDYEQHDNGKWVTTKEAKIGVEGEKELRCTICNYVIDIDSIPALEDDNKPTDPPVDDPTDPPVDDPTDPPVDDPTTPPVDDPTDPPADDPIDKPEPDKEPENPPVDTPDNVKLGDVNGNDEIDSMDYILLKRAYFGTFTLSEEAAKIADITKNGEIDSMDYILLKRAYFGTYTIQ